LYNKLVFWNSYGNGDVWESKEFVKEYMEKVPAKEYWYYNGKPSYITDDIPNLNHKHGTEELDDRKAWIKRDNDLYINTWIGRDSQYVLPGIGCVVEELYRMHNDILESLDLPKLQKEVYFYIPRSTDIYSLLPNILDIKQNFPYKQLIMICNGPVQSNQAENFNFDPAIDKLCKQYPDIGFITTSSTSVFDKHDNICDLSEWNLNNTAIVSKLCNIIVGRNSGPHVFAQCLDNWIDGSKTCISFTYKKVASHFVLSDHFPMDKVWSPATSVDEVYNVITGVIES
jgi:hypothetical protein